jgi:hypothetical protein
MVNAVNQTGCDRLNGIKYCDLHDVAQPGIHTTAHEIDDGSRQIVDISQICSVKYLADVFVL